MFRPSRTAGAPVTPIEPAAHGASRETAGSSGWDEGPVRDRSALFGLMTVLPLALFFWILIAAIILVLRA